MAFDYSLDKHGHESQNFCRSNRIVRVRCFIHSHSGSNHNHLTHLTQEIRRVQEERAKFHKICFDRRQR